MPAVKNVVIVGGGFGGVRVALDLARRGIGGVSITIISNKAHLEYYPTVYRVATGRSSEQVCIPLDTIFRDTSVNIINDEITAIDTAEKTVIGNERYTYDELVLAVGSETGYFNIPGLPEFSYGVKSIRESLALKNHLHAVLTPSADPALPPEQKVIAAHFMIVGGGPSGVELAGDLSWYAKRIAVKHGSDPALVTIDLIEAAPRLLPVLPADVSERVKKRLQSLGVNIYVSRTVTGEEVEQLLMKDMQIKTKSVVWTAGVKPNTLIGKIEGLELDRRGRIVVTEHLQAKGCPHLYVVGDAASTQYSGLAQTANHDGEYLARFLAAKLGGHTVPEYRPILPISAIPAGPNWAAVLWGNRRIYGLLASWLRHAADIRYLSSVLGLFPALSIFLAGTRASESCPVCTGDEVGERRVA
ncbi:FAD-dependent oxidoreductase [Patescibacteria group bacterium]|nr:FAD-dependent oxidoreductase [Patescibacteria group bacterium]